MGARARRFSTSLLAALAVASCARVGPPAEPAGPTERPVHGVIPLPSSVQLDPGDGFTVDSATVIFVPSGDPEAERIARYLSGLIGPSPERAPEVRVAAGPPPPGSISLATDLRGPVVGEEGYTLVVTADRITLRAQRPAGLFYGVQTLRQLLPPEVEYTAAYPRPLRVPAVRIADQPRFAWRGAMLDVARHFAPVEDVKRYIDLLALHKLNRLHLHLSDDQGWRIDIRSWPDLATHGGSTEVGGGPGGYYTQEQYADLVAYARDRFIVAVPEIDMPGHTNAALASYPELNCDGIAPPLYTGTEVGFSTLCVHSDTTYRFVDDVVREISALTPGPYFHVGGDEVEELTPEEYVRFIERVQEIVTSHGKRMVGWDEIAAADLTPGAVIQLWRPDTAHIEIIEAARRGASLVLSPADRIYLDMKYDSATVLGLTWAGVTDLRRAYDWDPATFLRGVAPSAILGVEAPLWAETVGNIRDIEHMAFPRLAAVAEVAWSPAESRSWSEFRTRLGAQAPRWSALGINFYRSPEVPWLPEALWWRGGER
ncbi:MAG: beta-N-acetylhexosaminidase [Gemmatimonadetes bacterium]|nr:beta-N-acetylhexosaminidase [Gemmatimonadota bacterium]